MIVRLLEIVAALLFIVTVLTQVVWPVMTGNRMFWLFRPRHPIKGLYGTEVDNRDRDLADEVRKARKKKSFTGESK